jgi:hypothetical protein
LAIVLGVVALAGLRPWATSSIAPTLIPSPGASAALGDATVVARGGPPGVGTGGIAAPTSPAKVSAPVAVSVPKQRTSHSQPALAVSAGRAVQAAAPVPVSAPPAPEPDPAPEPVVTTPAPPAAQAPAAPLVASAPPSGSPGTAGRPGTSVIGGGEPEQSCEGDEYVITVTFEEAEGEEVDYEEAEADILVQRLEADGSTTDLSLKGDLTDVRDLVATLVSEGNCVQVDVEPLPGVNPEEVSGANEEAPAPGDIAEPAVP